MRKKTETYTPGYSSRSRSFMARRRLETHAEFLIPFLADRKRILDCGCGPGTITADIAKHCAGSSVVGIDKDEFQVDKASEAFGDIPNLRFEPCSIYDLPFDDESFDCVFSHALFEHIGRPDDALSEIHRVLQPGGIAALASPDFGAFIMSPQTAEIEQAFNSYRKIQDLNGGNTLAGRYLRNWVSQAGFAPLKTEGRCENYPDLPLIGEYLADQLEGTKPKEAAAFRNWMILPGACFAQMWISTVAKKN